MRSWHPISPRKLDRQHLLGEHVELHVLYSTIIDDKPGWRNHPERLRWELHVPALVRRHDRIAAEMERRGYNHRSPLPSEPGPVAWPETWQPLAEMRRILREKQEV